MKIKWGALVVDGRGKIGGHVASKNRGGAYLRTKVTPVNPQSTAQTDVRSIFGQLSQAWSGLTDSQRQGWNEGVEAYSQTDIFGDLKNPSGKALYQRLNQNLLLAGASRLDDIPNTETAPAEVPSGISIGIGAGEIDIDNLASTAGVYIVVRSSGKVSSGTSFVKNKMRISSIQLSTAQDASVLYTDYTNKFGVPAVGDRIFFEVNYILPNGVQTPRVKMLASISA